MLICYVNTGGYSVEVKDLFSLKSLWLVVGSKLILNQIEFDSI